MKLKTDLVFQVNGKSVAYQDNYTEKGTKKKKKPAPTFDVDLTCEEEGIRGSITYMNLSKSDADLFEVGNKYVVSLVQKV